MRIGILSDTHGTLHSQIYDAFADVEAILHAGDVEGGEILEELKGFGLVQAVAGNCDFPGPELPKSWTGLLGGLRIAMTHGHLVGRGRTRSVAEFDDALVEMFSPFGPELIIHGHSHQARLVRHKSGVQILNPGAACRPRFGSTGASVCRIDTGIPGRPGDGPVFKFINLEY